MKTQLQALCEKWLNESSDCAGRFIKYESNNWGATDTLFWKHCARTKFEMAQELAREFKLDISKTVNVVGFIRPDELPRSQYE